MLCVPQDFDNNLTIDAMVDSRAYVSAIAQKELDTMKQKVPNNTFKFNDPLNFPTQKANGQLEKPLATATLKFDTGEDTFAEHFVVMKKLTGPNKALHFMRNNSVVIDTSHSLIQCLHLTMQVETTSEMNANPQVVFTGDTLAIPPRTTKTITTFVDHPSEWNKTGTVTPLEKFTQTASLLISLSISTIIDRKKGFRVTNTTETPYLVEMNTQNAEFSVVTPEQAKFIRSVDTAVLSMIPEDDADLTAYLNELFRKKTRTAE